MGILIEDERRNVRLEYARAKCQKQQADDEWRSRVSCALLENRRDGAEYLDNMGDSADQDAYTDCLVSTNMHISPPTTKNRDHV